MIKQKRFFKIPIIALSATVNSESSGLCALFNLGLTDG